MTDADLRDLLADADDAAWWLDRLTYRTLLLRAENPDLAALAAQLEDIRHRLAAAMRPVATRTNAGPLPTLGGRIPRRD